MEWLFAFIGLAIVVVIGLVVLGRESALLAGQVRPAVFDLNEAVEFIADRLPASAQARLSHEDVRWILLADADLLEAATAGQPAGDDPDEAPAEELVDEDEAVARVLMDAEASGRELEDEDVAAVLAARSEYLEAIGAIGPQVDAG